MTAPGTPHHVLLQLTAPELATLCGVNRTTARRWQSGKSRVPVTALKLVNLWSQGEVSGEGEHRESPRVRAVRLRTRMLQFHTIYNAAWSVRASQHGAPDYRSRKVALFVDALRKELEDCKDEEALIFAIADSLTAFPRGAPWEG